MDPSVVARQVFCQNSNPTQFDEFIFKSQRPIEYGGNAPTVTKFWPPIMPPLTESEKLEQKKMIQVDRKDYIRFIKNNPGLVPMPRRFRMDLAPLPNEIITAPPHDPFVD